MHKIGVLINKQTRKYAGDYLEGMDVPEECEVVNSFPEDGLFDPTYDDETGTWKHGLSPEEIDAIRNAPQPETPEQKIARLEAELAATKEENLTAFEAIAELYEMMLTGGGSA